MAVEYAAHQGRLAIDQTPLSFIGGNRRFIGGNRRFQGFAPAYLPAHPYGI
jgi:hypothetical protein